MSIVEKSDDQGKKVYKYQQPEWKILYERVAQLLDVFGEYITAHDDLTIEEVDVNEELLAELLVRIDKRKDYFMIFHDNTNMNEIKEAALLAYWILKFKPFKLKVDDIDRRKKYGQINEAFAVYVLYSAVKEETNRVSGMRFCVSSEYNRKIMYAFRFWDLSKESLILVAETLCEAGHAEKP